MNSFESPKVLKDSEEFFVIYKPAGWVVNSSETTIGQNVLQEWLSNMSYPISNSDEYRSGIVHRLDKETSGVMIIAKTESAFRNLQLQFKERKVEKTYLALLHGFLIGEGVVDVPIGRLPWNRERFGVFAGGRASTTYYKVISNYNYLGEKFSLVEFKPKTGRTHQIRVSAKYLGHPIVSDSFYAGRKTSRKDRTWCPRLFLHSGKISFLNPHTGKKENIESELASDLKKVLIELENLPQTI